VLNDENYSLTFLYFDVAIAQWVVLPPAGRRGPMFESRSGTLWETPH